MPFGQQRLPGEEIGLRVMFRPLEGASDCPTGPKTRDWLSVLVFSQQSQPRLKITTARVGPAIPAGGRRRRARPACQEDRRRRKHV
jgi:hypothetical protein